MTRLERCDHRSPAIAMRNVTEDKAMPRGRRPEGDRPLTNAERQARYRARCGTPPLPLAASPRRPVDRRSRPKRWRDAINELLVLQAAYANWIAALPDSLRDSATAEALEAIVDLDLTAVADCQPPRGYGRD